MQVLSGTFIITADATCISKTTFTSPRGDEVSREVTAKYKIEESTLTMKWKDAGTTVGAVDGDTFTMDNVGMIFKYRKQ